MSQVDRDYIRSPNLGPTLGFNPKSFENYGMGFEGKGYLRQLGEPRQAAGNTREHA